VARNSRYYQRVIQENNIDIRNCTPEDFPVLTKEMVLEFFDEIITDRQISKEKLADFLAESRKPHELFLNKYYVIHTSGSSGTVSYYVYSKKEFLQGIIPATRSYKLKLFRKMAYVAATRGHFMGVTMADTAMRWPLLYKDGQLLDINSPFGEIISGLNQMQPTVLSGYAFALRRLAEAQKDKGLHIQPALLQSGGEPLSTEDKEFIQNTFSVPLVNTYASSEHCVMGIGAEKYEGMYLMEDNLIFEIHPGFVNVTNLFKAEKEQTVQAIKERLGHILAEKLMTQVIFRVELVENLWVDPQTGKFKLITRASQPDLVELKQRITG